LVLLRVVEVSKRFGDVVALDRVSIDVRSGEILGVLGENGSGKSTLAKIIYGAYTPDSGRIELEVDGRLRTAVFTSPRDAILNGIIMISQRPQLVEELSIIENISLFLGVSPSVARKVVASTLNKFGIELDLERVVNTLSYTEKQLVELVRALSFKPRLLIVDEVTTYLPKDIRAKFYEVLRMFASLGGSVMLITHKIPEALEICDRVVVLRKGRLAGVYDKNGGLSAEEVRKAMFNESYYTMLVPRRSREAMQGGQAVLEVIDAVVLDDYGRKAVDGVSLSVFSGQVLAIVGIAGNGQKELCEGIAGLRKLASGMIRLSGEDVTRLSAAERVLRGLSYIPEDPFRDGVVMDLTVSENIRLFSRRAVDNGDIAKVLEELKVNPPNPRLKVYKLSGGNVQKISISRLRLSKPRCIVAYNPTRMLDEASSAHVKFLLRTLADEWAGVLLVSEDVDEALDIADEVAVISRGRIVKSFNVSGPSVKEEIEKAMTLYG